MKPAITTITLLVANVLVLGYILLIDRHLLSSEEAGEHERWLLNFDPDVAARVKFRTSEGEAEVVRQADGSWIFTAPFEDRFSPELMAELLKSASKMRINHAIEAKEIRKEGWGDDYFGFGANSIDVEIFDAEGGNLGAVELGGSTPFENQIYARPKGEGADQPVKLVWGYVREVVQLPVDELRDRRLIYAKANDIFRVKFYPPSANAFHVHVERGADKKWHMEKPLEARCEQKLVNELVGKLVKLELEEFVDEPGAEMEAAFDTDKRYEIVFRQRAPKDENSRVTTIEFGKLPSDENDPFVLAKVSGRSGLFHVDKRVHYEFGMDGNSLRARTLGDFEYSAVTSLRIKRLEKEEIFLERLGNAWVLHRDPDDLAKIDSANGRMVKQLIEELNEEEILRFADEAPADLDDYGLKDPPIEITIMRKYYDPNEVVKQGELPTVFEKKDVLMIGVGFKNQPGGEAFATFKGENYVYKISEILPAKIGRADARSYKSLQLWPRFSPFDFRKVTLKDKFAGPPLEMAFDYKSNLWTVIRDGIDVTGDIERVVLDDYLQFLGRPPSANRWTMRSKASDGRLLEPDIEVTIELMDPQNPAIPREITFAASATIPNAPLFYGRVNKSSDVTVLDDQMFRELTKPLLRLSTPR